MVTDGSRFVFTDIYNFIERIHTFLKDNLTAYEIERQIKAIFSTLFVETAIIWWTTELTNDMRNMLRSDKFTIMIYTLRQRFTPDRNITMAFFNKEKLCL